MLKSIFKLYTEAKDQEIQIMALKTLDKEFLSQDDPNLKYLGLQILNTDIKPEIVSNLFSKKLMNYLTEEKEQQTIDLVIQIMQKIINEKNYEFILNSLFG